MVVANVSLVSEFFKSRKCRCLRGLFERGKFCLTELSQSQSKRATKLRHAPIFDNGVIILNLRRNVNCKIGDWRCVFDDLNESGYMVKSDVIGCLRRQNVALMI